jgi:hypothetical protein
MLVFTAGSIRYGRLHHPFAYLEEKMLLNPFVNGHC